MSLNCKINNSMSPRSYADFNRAKRFEVRYVKRLRRLAFPGSKVNAPVDSFQQRDRRAAQAKPFSLMMKRISAPRRLICIGTQVIITWRRGRRFPLAAVAQPKGQLERPQPGEKFPRISMREEPPRLPGSQV